MEKTEVEQRWLDALEWFNSQPMGRRKVELTAIIHPIYEKLQQAPDIESLHSLYVDPEDAQHALRTAQDAYPDNEHLWNLSRTRDVAYGRRLTELRRMGGRAGAQA